MMNITGICHQGKHSVDTWDCTFYSEVMLNTIQKGTVT